jgi:thiol-disulfide isomerase/thioredoxin
MKLRRFFVLATAPPLLAFLPPAPAWAGEAGMAQLQKVRAQALPVADDPRLAQVLTRHKGKPVLVNFWATWCEPCRDEMPALGRLAARWQPRGLAVETVAVADNAQRVEDFLWEVLPANQTLAVLHDREQVLSRAWGARMLPTTVVLDRRHRIVLRGAGAIDWDAPALDRQLEKLFN